MKHDNKHVAKLWFFMYNYRINVDMTFYINNTCREKVCYVWNLFWKVSGG